MGSQKKWTSTRRNQCKNHKTALTGSEGMFQGGTRSRTDLSLKRFDVFTVALFGTALPHERHDEMYILSFYCSSTSLVLPGTRILTYSPRLKGGGFSPSRESLPVSPRTAYAPFEVAGLAFSPQADTTASPAAKMLYAALMSRSWQTPQPGQTHSRTSRVRMSRLYPQALHVLLVASHRSMMTTVRPYHAALYSSCRRISPHPTSLMALARQWFLSMPATCKSSRQITWFSRISLVVTLCW